MKKETVVFRDQYHLDDFCDDEILGDDSITDTSNYIPTEELIKKFLTGQVTGSSSSLSYEVDERVTEDQAFQNEAEQQAVNNEHENIGEAELKGKLKGLKLKVAAELKKPKKQEKPTQSAPEAELPPQGAGKPVQGAPDQANQGGQGKSPQESQKQAQNGS